MMRMLGLFIQRHYEVYFYVIYLLFYPSDCNFKPCSLFQLNEQKLGHAIRLPRLNLPTKAKDTAFFTFHILDTIETTFILKQYFKLQKQDRARNYYCIKSKEI